MITILRKHRQWLMIVIAILCIPFVFYFSKTDFSAQSLDRFGKVYGRNISQVEFKRNIRLFELARQMTMYTLLQDLIGNAANENDAYLQFTVNRTILSHEAERLGIEPTTQEILGVVKGIQLFQNEGQFDVNKYNGFAQTVLPSMGFNETQIEELAGDQLRLERVKALLGMGAQIPESESKRDFEQIYGKLDVTVVRLHGDDFVKNIQLTDSDLTKYYEAHKAELKSEEKRQVEFVSFAFTEEQKKLSGKERIDALQNLANRANDFTQALLEKGASFQQAAAKFQVPVRTTGPFTAAAPDPQLAANPQLAQSAFQLTKQDPNSDAIQAADGFYVLHLIASDEARQLTFDEAKAKIVEALQKERLVTAISAKAAELADQIREKMKSGATAEAAIQQTGLKPEKLPPFSILDPPIPQASPSPEKKDSADLTAIKQNISEMQPGEVSELIRTADGGMIAVFEKREPLDPVKFEQARPLLEGNMLQNQRTIVFYEWLANRRRAAGVVLAKL